MKFDSLLIPSFTLEEVSDAVVGTCRTKQEPAWLLR